MSLGARQLALPIAVQPTQSRPVTSCRERLQSLLSGDLDFHDEDSAYASHNFHAFPAKFPPQLPRKFIEELTQPGDLVLDPMVGSGTTVVEAFLAGRRGLGFDIDPMALRLCQVKVTPLALEETSIIGNRVVRCAQENAQKDGLQLLQDMQTRYRESEREFINYWFLPSTQVELMALLKEIEQVQEPGIRRFLEAVFSAIIITKSGGVSLARDLAHTRPHRVQDKKPRSALEEYRKRLSKNLDSLVSLMFGGGVVNIVRGDARNLALGDQTVDLIVTSPPYASNAIDYMRAHKFSLVWLGYSLDGLSRLRQEYVGHDAVRGYRMAELPDYAGRVVAEVNRVDQNKAKVLHRYYSEMTCCLTEMVRVLKPGKAAIVVVGSSTMRGVDTRTDVCLAEIGKCVGFELVGVGVRSLDRDRRMMPARRTRLANGPQIEERMHEEYVLGFLKPEGRSA